MIVVSDTSPLSYLGKLDRLSLLPQLFGEVVVPPEVMAEIERGSASATLPQGIRQTGWIRIMEPGDQAEIAELERFLDRGEAEAIVLAEELKATLLLIDEYDGRKIAEERGIEITGTLGVLLRGKRAGLIAGVRPEVERLLKETSFFCSEDLLRKVLALAGE